MDFEKYKRLKAINASFIKACHKSAYDGWKCLHEPSKASDAMNFGTAVHAAILEPEKFNSLVAVSPKFDRRTKVGKFEGDLFDILNVGKIVIDEEEKTRIDLIVKRCLAIPCVSEALKTFEKEKSLLWSSNIYGFMKGRLDLVNHETKVIIDVKTTRDAERNAFIRQTFQLRYDIQMRHYLESLGGSGTVYAIAIESDTAQVACYDMTDIVTSDFTDRRYKKGLEVAIEVLQMTECPPKFKPEIINLSLPQWAETEEV